jgi:hypothetical protein
MVFILNLLNSIGTQKPQIYKSYTKQISNELNNRTIQLQNDSQVKKNYSQMKVVIHKQSTISQNKTSNLKMKE